MSIRTYTDIIIDGRGFSIIETPQKKESALAILSCIETVLRKGLLYVPADDSYSKMSHSHLREKLKLKAKSIRDGYLNKSKNLSWLRRFFGGVARQEQKIVAIYDRIAHLVFPPLALDLPKELHQPICAFLHMRDLGKLAQVNKHANIQVKQATVRRAKEFGYQGRDSAEARDYLKELFQSIAILVKDGVTPESYVVRHDGRPFWQVLDREATLRKLRCAISKKIHLSSLHEMLIHYVRRGRIEVVRLLLLLEADPNLPLFSGGGQPIHWAAQEGHFGTVRLLLSYGARVNDLCYTGFPTLCIVIASPVHKKPESEIKEIVKSLLQAGADLNMISPHGNSSLHLAAHRGHSEIVTLLLESGAPINSFGYEGNTALMFASQEGRENTVKVLLASGADKTLLNHHGKSAKDLAKNNSIKLLLS